MKIAIQIENQDEYTICRKYIQELGLPVGFDYSSGKGFIYCIDTNEKDKYNAVKIGCNKDIPEIKKQKYKYVKASEYFAKELEHINNGFCCIRLRKAVQVEEEITYKNNKYYINDLALNYCPFCGEGL